MTGLRHKLVRFWRAEKGAAAVEFALVIALFLFIFFTIIDFGRLAMSRVMIEKAVYLAARTAIVRPPACAGVPDEHMRHPDSPIPAPRYGTNCSAGNVCNPEPTISCVGTAGNPTADEIWNRIQPLLPAAAAIDDLTFTYAFDSSLGFLGGPYTPMVTVSLDLDDADNAFYFVSPLSSLAAAAGGSILLDDSAAVALSHSVSLPAEDLNVGTGG